MTTKLIAASVLPLLSTAQLVLVFNDASEAYNIGTVVKKFADKPKAVKRIQDIMEKHDLHLGRRGDNSFILLSRVAYDDLISHGAEVVELTQEEVAAGAPAETATTLAGHVEKNKTKEENKAKEPSTGKRGRTAGYAGKLLKVADGVAESPHNNGSARDNLFKMVFANPGVAADTITDVASLSYELRKGYFVAYDGETGEALSAADAVAEKPAGDEVQQAGEQASEEAPTEGEAAAEDAGEQTGDDTQLNNE